MGSDIASLGTGRTGGRAAAGGTIAGRYALAVGKPDTPTPAGWEWRLLTDVAALETGHTPSRRHPEYWDGDIPWLGIKDANEHHGRTIDETTQHVTQAGLDNSSARLLPKGTVCLSRTASIGFITRMGRPMATSQDFVNWICGPELDERFLIYVLLGDRESLLQFAHGSTHQTIYFPEVKAFHICLPPLPEQRAIAGVLGSLDDKIELNRRMNRTLESIARAQFRHRFLDHPDPAWEVKPLDEVAKVAIGKTPPRKETQWFSTPPEGLPWVSIRDMGGADVFLDQTRESLTEEAIERHRIKQVPAATLLLSFKLTVGRVVITLDRATTNEAIAHLPLRASSPVGLFYLYCYLTSFDFSSLGSTSSIATAVNSKTIKSLPVTVPDLSLLQQFEETVSPLFTKIKILQGETRTLSALRDTLLPRLLSGALRPPADRGT